MRITFTQAPIKLPTLTYVIAGCASCVRAYQVPCCLPTNFGCLLTLRAFDLHCIGAWAPSLRAAKYHGPLAERAALRAKLDDEGFDVLLTTYTYFEGDHAAGPSSPPNLTPRDSPQPLLTPRPPRAAQPAQASATAHG